MTGTAGAVPAGNWNNAAGAAGSIVGAIDDSGANSGATVYVYFNSDGAGTHGYTANDGTNSATAFGTQSGGAGTNYPLAGMDGFIGSTSPTFATSVPANYVLLSGLDGPSFTITGVDAGGNAANRARPNGFQIVSLAVAAVPEPASIAMWSTLGLGLAAFGFFRLRRKK